MKRQENNDGIQKKIVFIVTKNWYTKEITTSSYSVNSLHFSPGLKNLIQRQQEMQDRIGKNQNKMCMESIKAGLPKILHDSVSSGHVVLT